MKEPVICRHCGHDLDTEAPEHCTAPRWHVTGAPADFRRRVEWFKTKSREDRDS